MKKQCYYYWLVAALCLPFLLTVAHAQVVVQHLGASDPLTEGFVLTAFTGNPEVAPVFDDFGRDAWMIRPTSLDDRVRYVHPLTDQQGENAMTYGWALSATVRFLDLPPVTGLTFHTGNGAFTMSFRTHPNDPSLLRVSNTSGISYDFEGHDGGYHTYTYVYDPLTELAKLWIDGVDTGMEIPPGFSTLNAEFWWRTGESLAQANWNEITLTIVPEPATVALLTGVGALFVAGIIRRRKRRDASQPGDS